MVRPGVYRLFRLLERMVFASNAPPGPMPLSRGNGGESDDSLDKEWSPGGGRSSNECSRRLAARETLIRNRDERFIDNFPTGRDESRPVFLQFREQCHRLVRFNFTRRSRRKGERSSRQRDHSSRLSSSECFPSFVGESRKGNAKDDCVH